MTLDDLVSLFSLHRNRTLIDVWTQSCEIRREADVQDAPPFESEKRIVLDFKDRASGAIESVVIRVTEDDSGMHIFGFTQYPHKGT